MSALPGFLFPLDLDERIDSDIVFVIDQSGSMNTYDPNNTRIDATKMFVENMLDTQRVGIVEFTSSGSINEALTDDKDALLSTLDTMYNPGGLTNITDGLRKAGELFEESEDRQKVVVLLTDGESNRERGQELPMAQELADEGVIINTIALGSEVDLELVEEIANISGGSYNFIPTEDDGATQEEVDRLIENIFEWLWRNLGVGVYEDEDDHALPLPWEMGLEYEDLKTGL